jgi:hypothetical protein
MYEARSAKLARAVAHGLAPLFDDGVMRYRFYEPQIGRFTSFDSFEAPPGDPVALHKYNYASANPVTHIDPSGHMSLVEGLVTIGVIAVLMGAFVGGYHAYYTPTKAGGTRLVVTATRSLDQVWANESAGNTTLSGLVNAISNKQGNKELEDLIIIAHGQPGLIQFADDPAIVRLPVPGGDPRTIWDTGDASTPVIQTTSSAKLFGQQLKAKLKFKPNARIILNVCESNRVVHGLGNTGDLPQAVADGAGVTVYAPNIQVTPEMVLYPENEKINLMTYFTPYRPRTGQ